jgi:hypothetical protein
MTSFKDRLKNTSLARHYVSLITTSYQIFTICGGCIRTVL